MCQICGHLHLYSGAPISCLQSHQQCSICCHFCNQVYNSSLDAYLDLAPMKIKGCLLIPPMLNAKSRENFLSPDQNWANFGGFGGLGVRAYKKLRFLLQKAHVFVNPRRLSHSASKLVEGCDLQVGWGKKPRKSQRLP